MDIRSATKQINIESDIRDARKTIATGLVASTAKRKNKYWNKWKRYAGIAGIDPFLSSLSRREIETLQGFATRVRAGWYGYSRRVRAGTVSAAITAIGQAIIMDGKSRTNVLKDGDKFILPINRLIHAYELQDPPAKFSLAVPVEILYKLDKVYQLVTNKAKQIRWLIILSFFFLLRVGEYTKPNKETRTVQFRMKDISLWKNNKLMDICTTKIETLLQADAVTLHIDNQKNGRRGQTLHHEKEGSEVCPVRAAVELVVEWRKYSKNTNELICDYRNNDQKYSIRATDISKTLKHAASLARLPQKGFPLNRITPHSLRAGGAMALKLNGLDIITIKKYGRWTSTTFMMCMHEQISMIAKGVSSKMGKHVMFNNVAATTA